MNLAKVKERVENLKKLNYSIESLILGLNREVNEFDNFLKDNRDRFNQKSKSVISMIANEPLTY
jgi:hypothetical protein